MKSRDYLYQASADTLGVMRLAVFGLCFVYVLGVPYGQLEILPPTLHQPTKLFGLLPSAWQSFLISGTGLSTLKPLLLVCLACAFAGIRPYRLWALASVVLLLVFDMVYKGYSFYFWHGQFGLIYSAALLAFAPANDAYRLGFAGRRTQATGAAYRIVPLSIGVVFTTCYALLGIRRIADGGYAIYIDDSILNFTAARAFEPAFFTFQAGYWPLASPILAVLLKVGFAIVTAFEALSPLALVSLRFRFAWLWVMVLFHLSTLFSMNIFFWENALLLLLFLTPFAYRLGQTPQDRHPVVFFDGACTLCGTAVRWLAKRDTFGVLRFAPLAGETAKKAGIGAVDAAESMYLQDESGVHCRSTAALRSLLPLGGGWAMLGSLLLSVPQAIRDSVYDMVARNRHRCPGPCGVSKHSPASENILP